MSRAYSRVRVGLMRCTSSSRGSRNAARLGGEPVPETLADLLAEVAEGHYDLERIPARDPLEHLDDAGRGVQTNGQERAVLVVVRGRAGKHDPAAHGRDQGPDRFDPRLVTRLPDLREAVPQPLAFADGQMVVDRVGVAQRQKAVRQRGALDSRFLASAAPAHGTVLRRVLRSGEPRVTGTTAEA